MIYTGIGARDTPVSVLKNMVSFGRFMASWNHTLRSGGAQGADEAFELGCDNAKGKKEIYLPFKGFRRNNSELFGTDKQARLLAKTFHPAWERLGNTGREFMGRNAYQILGPNLNTPTSFVICWTPKGQVTGGTGQALRMAQHYKIPVYNFAIMSLEEINSTILELV